MNKIMKLTRRTCCAVRLKKEPANIVSKDKLLPAKIFLNRFSKAIIKVIKLSTFPVAESVPYTATKHALLTS